MAYERARPDWVNFPDTSTPIQAAHLDKIDQAVYELKTTVRDPRDYGAAADGVTDDTEAYQAALDAGGLVLVPEGVSMIGQLRMRSYGGLVGTGWGCQLRLIAGTSADMLVLQDAVTEQVTIRNLRLRGNRHLQSSLSSDAIHFANTGPYAFSADAHHILQDLMIETFAGSGVYLGGSKTSACQIRNVYVDSVDEYCFYVDWADNDFIGCTAVGAKLAGFYLTANAGSNRFTNCKAFYNGDGMAASTDRGEGYYIKGIGNSFAACEAQENQGHGWALDTATDNTLVGCTADANGRYAGLTTSAGFYITNSQRNQIVGMRSGNRALTSSQQYGVYFNPANTGQGNRVEGTITNNTTNGINVWSSTTSTPNDVALGASRGLVRLGTGGTPDITSGGIIHHILTGNHTVGHVSNRWPGMRITFIFEQDATGSRTITFGAGGTYKVNSTWVPALTASKADIITFVFDGLKYWQESCSIEVG